MGISSLHMSTCDCKIQDNGTLKIAIPMANGVFSEHFGGAKAFLIFEGDRQTLCLTEAVAAPAANITRKNVQLPTANWSEPLMP